MRVSPMERPMNGWAKAAPSGRWHQVDFDHRSCTAVLCCSGRTVVVDPAEVMDYRWLPSGGWCYHPPCRREVAP